MPLDDTVAGPNANSYIDVVDADAFAAIDVVNGAAWTAVTTEQKEDALQAASADVDLYKRSAGIRYSTLQALLFPRSVDVDATDLPYLLPDVRRATYEQAVYLVRNGQLIADAAKRRARALFNFSDDDGSGQPALNSSFGLFAPKMTEYLDRIGAAGRGPARTIVSVPMTSSFE